MEIALTMKEYRQGQIQSFLSAYYDREIEMSCNTHQVTYFFSNPVEAHDMVCTFIDNEEDYMCEIWVSFNGMHVRASKDNLYLVLREILRTIA